ncbi:hypothetical protein F5J12DRAFT_300193 [Pisolithus orientalis]|uniref:uncharacterized protein n=1 Tax=Pisolithus orientalis TaxID=936130 RepID=UPI002225529E|nr:uncharacterized protein F5J12DRAFT_300193 [Pisolithus orientalis]KAI6030604.1 hypothetical protein F5J12DRAFT_300193 [Pisolithus orientalis]
MDATTINQLLYIERNAQTIRFLQVVPTTFMVYDCVLYLDKEINYIWKKRMSNISVAYLIFRYFGIVYLVFSLAEFVANTNTLSKAISYDFPILSMWINCLSVWFVQAILGLRLYALYNGSKKVLLVIGLGFIAECTIMIVCVTLLSISSEGQGLLVLGSKISALPATARKVYINYGAIAVYESMLFSLALSAAVHRCREKRGPRPARSGAKRLRDILIEGNVVYFLANTVYAIFYFVVSLTLPSEWLFGVLSIGLAMTSTIGCRLILHIRSAAPHSSTSPDHIDDEARLAPQSWSSKVLPSSSCR